MNLQIPTENLIPFSEECYKDTETYILATDQGLLIQQVLGLHCPGQYKCFFVIEGQDAVSCCQDTTYLRLVACDVVRKLRNLQSDMIYEPEFLNAFNERNFKKLLELGISKCPIVFEDENSYKLTIAQLSQVFNMMIKAVREEIEKFKII